MGHRSTATVSERRASLQKSFPHVRDIMLRCHAISWTMSDLDFVRFDLIRLPSVLCRSGVDPIEYYSLIDDHLSLLTQVPSLVFVPSLFSDERYSIKVSLHMWIIVVPIGT